MPYRPRSYLDTSVKQETPKVSRLKRLVSSNKPTSSAGVLPHAQAKSASLIDETPVLETSTPEDKHKIEQLKLQLQEEKSNNAKYTSAIHDLMATNTKLHWKLKQKAIDFDILKQEILDASSTVENERS
jgi:hypothetical protein